MRSGRAKVLHELAGVPLVRHPLAALAPLRPARVVVVVGHQADAVREAVADAALPDARIAVQAEQRGTGHAVLCARDAVGDDFAGDVVILYGDVPLIRTATLAALLDVHRRETADLTLVTTTFAHPTGYGRILRGPDGRVTGIVEERDASEAERAITEINPGIYAVRSEILFRLLAELRPDNTQGELYLTDLVGLVVRGGGRIATCAGTPDEVAGVNTRAELARMEAMLKADIVGRWMAAGVTFEDPATAYVGPEVSIGPDTVIGPNVQLRGRTRIGSGCRIDGTAYVVDSVLGDRVHLLFACVLDGAVVGDDARIGPFARLRPGTRLAERVHIGNFVETKQAAIGVATKANHLAYLGDCEVGPDTNVGAGTITCNYDGFRKHRTTIGARVQIGSDTQLVAPVSVGDDAYVGAGTTITRDVPAGALAVSRVPQRHVEGWTARRRAIAAGTSAAPTGAQPAALARRVKKRRATSARRVKKRRTTSARRVKKRPAASRRGRKKAAATPRGRRRR
jgi:bifunctional UDP-N-acetylglucosamine pyrophosphorylase/glucosamine-1-phosphate N-acetyltransferase